MSTTPNAPTVDTPLSAEEQQHVLEWARETAATRPDGFRTWIAEQVLKYDAALLAARREVTDAQRYRALRAGIGIDLRIVRFGNPPDEDVTHIDGPSGIDAFADELRAALAATQEET